MSEDQVERSDALLPPERSQFNRRLASFGLGETPDPLLTHARPPATPKGTTDDGSERPDTP